MASLKDITNQSKLLLADVQGDILNGGMPKKSQTFWFFTILDAKDFSQQLTAAAPLFCRGIDIAYQRSALTDFKNAVAGDVGPEANYLPMVNANIAFSIKGLRKIQEAIPNGSSLGLDHLPSDGAFARGMRDDRGSLGDPSTPDPWQKEYSDAAKPIHGVITVAGSHATLVAALLEIVMRTFGPTLSEVVREVGNVRPARQDGHEHFGFEDGISQPIVDGFPNENPKVLEGTTQVLPAGWNTVDRTVILVDSASTSRPGWMQNGSFLVFRKLEQNVGAWRDFLDKNASSVGISGSTAREASDKLGARLMGRWQSGCPVVLSPEADNPDPKMAFNNIFDFAINNNIQINTLSLTSSVCPFGAHIRKTNPRNLDGRPKPDKLHRILRRGIPYGEDYDNDKTNPQRGLLFACYQSRIEDGFQFIQVNWANSTQFPTSQFNPKVKANPGIDLIMGQAPGSTKILMDVVNRSTGQIVPIQQTDNGLNPFITPRGGEYFFMPSFSALTTELAGKQRSK